MDCERVYIAHPYNGITSREKERLDNLEETTMICRKLHEISPLLMPVSPLHAFSFMDGIDRDQVLDYCYHLIDVCSMVWVFGDWETSEGTIKEIFYALKARKRVYICSLSSDSDQIYKNPLNNIEDFCRLATDRLLTAKITTYLLNERFAHHLREKQKTATEAAA